MKNKRRNHSSRFKVKVALGGCYEASEFDVLPNQIAQWKNSFLFIGTILPRLFYWSF